jgi:hypothetical protein
MRNIFKLFLLLFALTSTTVSVRAQAQVSAPPPAPANQTLSDAQLDQLLGPIALYPDPLIAEILPASTLPTQIVLADRYVTGGGDPNQIGQQPWDASVQAVARYPSVLKWMDDNLGETTELGQAFLDQQPAVMASIQRLRATASKLGNLQTTSQQQVTNDDGDIEIDPADDQEMYVPVYQPDQVYDDEADGSPFITFGIGYPIGDWLDDDFDWGNDDLIYWDQGYSRPAHWWHQSRRQRNNGHTRVWHQSNRSNTAATNRGDRGWGNNAPAPAAMRTELARQSSQQNERANGDSRTAPDAARIRPDAAFTGGEPAHQAPQQNERALDIPRSTTAPVEHNQSFNRPESNGALIGVQSTHDTRTYSAHKPPSIHHRPRPAVVGMQGAAVAGTQEAEAVAAAVDITRSNPRKELNL